MSLKNQIKKTQKKLEKLNEQSENLNTKKESIDKETIRKFVGIQIYTHKPMRVITDMAGIISEAKSIIKGTEGRTIDKKDLDRIADSPEQRKDIKKMIEAYAKLAKELKSIVREMERLSKDFSKALS